MLKNNLSLGAFSPAIALAGIVAFASVAQAQVCSQHAFTVAPQQFSGVRINSVSISTMAPDDWMARAPLLNRLHARTRASRVRADLLFAAGDSVDTLKIAESLRRLRSTALFERAELLVSRCAGVQGVDLSVVTRDAWSLTPVMKARGGSADLGLVEKNAFGTGTGARVVLQSDHGSLGLGISTRVVGKPLSGEVMDLGSVRYSNGQSWHAIIGNKDISSTNKSTLYVRTSFSEREPKTQPGNNFQRSGTSLLFGERFNGGATRSASYFLFGAETEHADLYSPAGSGLPGTNSLRRSYAGINAGFARVAARYDTLSWLLHSNGIVDVPFGIEGEAVFGIGRDKITGNTADHLDLWIGRAFLSKNHGALLLGDVWASGYSGDDRLSASTLRSSWILFNRARRGYWTWRLTGERLANPDPDVRALASADLLSPALPVGSKLAEAALALSVERTVHLLPVTHSLMLDAAAFGGASARWDAAVTSKTNSFGAFVAGVGLRLNPARTPRNSVRLDLGIPMTTSAAIRHHPYVALTFMSWPFFDRQRDGRKTP